MAELVKTVDELREVRAKCDTPVGLVATMGGLHAGHRALLKQARAECSVVIGTIFVNKIQFNDARDFETYPSSLDDDFAIMDKAGIDYVFAPDEKEIFPSGDFRVVTGKFDAVPEVRARGEHFNGVTTVVAKLFVITRPQRAYFGEKDVHQLHIIRAMNRDLLFGIEIVAVPTVRNADGLAHSSRNLLLSSDQLSAATVLHRALKEVESVWKRGVRNCNNLRRMVQQAVSEEPLVKLEYVSVADADTLQEINTVTGDVMISAAIKIDNVRLVDNLTLANV